MIEVWALHERALWMCGQCGQLGGRVGVVGSSLDAWVPWATYIFGLIVLAGDGVGCMAAPTPFLSRGSDVFWHLLWVKNSHRRSKQSCKQMPGVLEGGAVTPVSVSEGVPSWPLLSGAWKGCRSPHSVFAAST